MICNDDRGFFPRPLELEQTPCALVDLDVLENNARVMLDRCQRHGVQLRPNVKTHKCLEVAVLQTDGSKRCISVSTVREAEYFAAAGFDDILLSTIFTEDKMTRITELANRLVTFSLLLDSDYCLDLLDSHKLSGGKSWRVYLKVNCGNQRSGVQWDGSGALPLVQRIKRMHGVELEGLYVHEGDSYYKRGAVEISDLGDVIFTRLETLSKRLADENIVIKQIAVGSTPTCSHPSKKILNGLTEFHPGNYIFYDVQQTILGSCKREDIAFKVMTRIKGHYPERNQLLIDAGFVAMSHDGNDGRKDMDGGICWIEGHPELRLLKMHQEVGFIDGKETPLDYSKYPIGSALILLPYHSCATACQHRKYVVVRGDEVHDIWKTCCGW